MLWHAALQLRPQLLYLLMCVYLLPTHPSGAGVGLILHLRFLGLYGAWLPHTSQWNDQLSPGKPAWALAEWAGGREPGLTLRNEHILVMLCLADTFGKLGPTFRAGSWHEAHRKPLVLPAPWACTGFEPEQSCLCAVTAADNCSWVASYSPKGSHQLNNWRIAGLSQLGYCASLWAQVPRGTCGGCTGWRQGQRGPGEEGETKD